MAYLSYRGRCIGRLMAFCYKLTSQSDCWKFGFDSNKGGYVKDSSEKEIIATYTWEEDTDIPIFVWSDKYKIFEQDFARVKEEILEYDMSVFGKGPYSIKTETEKAKEKEKKLHISYWKSFYYSTVKNSNLDIPFEDWYSKNIKKMDEA